MDIVKYENHMNGESIYIPTGIALPEIPDDILELLKEYHIQSFSNSDYYFSQLPARCSISSMACWFELLAKAKLAKLEIHTSMFGKTDILFRFNLSNGMNPALILADAEQVMEMPESLKPLGDVYNNIGGICHRDWGYAGGLFATDSIRTVNDMGLWLADDCIEDPSHCYCFYGNSSGDNVCFKKDGTAILYEHEKGELSEIGSVESFLDQYFNFLMDGQEF